MILLDTDTLSLLMRGHARITERTANSDAVAITIITRIEILQGRFASLLKAANGAELLRAQHWLAENERYIGGLEVISFDEDSAKAFDDLRRNKKLKKIGRADLLIASIALAGRATLISRNVKHFQFIPGIRVENWAD